MHNIELFIDECNIKENFLRAPQLLENYNIYALPEGRIGIFNIINLKNKIISDINNEIYCEHKGRYDTALFYYPRYYINSKSLFPVVILNSNIEFYDKLAVLLFECLCYYLVQELGIDLYINCAYKKNILTEEIQVSSVNFLRAGKYYSTAKFEKTFNSEIYRNHYRLYLNYEETKDKKRLSILYTDLIIFLKHFDIDDKSAEEVADVAIELVGNACEHAHSDCLFDLDIAENYSKKDEEGNFRGNYYAINIGIVNFSNKLFYHDIKEKIKIISNKIDLSERYQSLLQAHKNHKNFFDDKYIEEYFYLIAAFQNKISGRIDNSITGGTGL